MTRFLVVPQWQGSSSPRSMQLVVGAEAIAGDLPRAASGRVEVPLEAGDALGSGVQRLSTLLQVRRGVDEAMSTTAEPVVLIGGDASVAVGGVGHAAARHPGLAVVWATAHPGLHTPDSSPSHAFEGMSLRAVLGEGPDGLRLPEGTVRPPQVVLVGARGLDDGEDEYTTAAGIRRVESSALADSDAIAAAVAATGAQAAYVHVSVDVLDPEQMPGAGSAEPFGARLAELVAALKTLRASLPLVGASLTGFQPSSEVEAESDMATVLRLVGALA